MSGQSWRYEDLEVFKRAYGLSLEMHRASLTWPREEQFGGIADQLRRSSKSVCALLAEGSARQWSSQAEFRRYVIMAMGSADEVRLWCRYAEDLGYVEEAVARRWQEEAGVVARMLQSLARRLQSS